MLNFYRQHQGKIILIAIVMAFMIGISFPHIFIKLEFISNTFINLLKLCALPIVLCSLIVTIGNLQYLQELKIVARNSILYILLTEIIAVTIGVLIFRNINFNYNINATSLLNGVKYTSATTTSIIPEHIFNYIFSDNILKALVNFDVLPVVIFSIMFGITCALNPHKAKPVLDFLHSTRDLFLALLNGVMYLAPLAIFVLIGNAIASSYLGGNLSTNLLGLLKFVSLFFIALFIHFLWQLLLVVVLYRKLGVKLILSQSIPIFTTAFISSSSLATLPIALEKAYQFGADKKVVDFMLPVCASMNFASGMMYEMTACLFFMHILGIQPDLLHIGLLALACILTGIAVGAFLKPQW